MGTKRCHYVPQFYLNYFIPPNSDTFWIYDKKDLAVRPQNPKNTTVISGYYILSEDTGDIKKDFLEDLLQKLEGEVKPIFDKWIASPAKFRKEDMVKVTPFLAFMHCRVPRMVEAVKEIYKAGLDYCFEEMRAIASNPKKLKKDYKKYRKYIGNSKAMTFDEFADFTTNPTKYGEFEPNEKSATLTGFLATQNVSEELLQMNWRLCVSKGSHFFITSDAPLNVFVPDENGYAIFGAGFANQNVEVAFPVTPKICLVMDRRHTEKLTYVDAFFVREINRRTTYQSERFIISPFKSNNIKKLLKEFSRTYKKPKLDSKIIIEGFRKEENKT